MRFEDGEVEVGTDIPTDRTILRKFVISQPFHKAEGSHVHFSHSDCNTVAKESVCHRWAATSHHHYHHQNHHHHPPPPPTTCPA